jgi:recombinational DNA repair protein (RecF pathway)
VEYWDCTDTPDYENVQRILSYLSHMTQVPGAALTALERLLDLAYPGEKTTFVCRICGERVTVPQTSGKRPTTLCKKADCRRTANRQRIQRYRARRALLRQESSSLLSVSSSQESG